MNAIAGEGLWCTYGAVNAVAGVDLHFGRVSVTEQVIAYQRKAIRDGSTLAVIPLILPEVTFQTEAVWFSPGAGCGTKTEAAPRTWKPCTAVSGGNAIWAQATRGTLSRFSISNVQVKLATAGFSDCFCAASI